MTHGLFRCVCPVISHGTNAPKGIQLLTPWRSPRTAGEVYHEVPHGLTVRYLIPNCNPNAVTAVHVDCSIG